VRRGEYRLVCNFAGRTLELACPGDVIELATAADTNLHCGCLKLPPMSGALIR
jgi:hypothetical protein